MPLVENIANYDEKEPTNVRLIKELKEKVIQEATEKGITMADVINNILRLHYKI